MLARLAGMLGDEMLKLLGLAVVGLGWSRLDVGEWSEGDVGGEQCSRAAYR